VVAVVGLTAMLAEVVVLAIRLLQPQARVIVEEVLLHPHLTVVVVAEGLRLQAQMQHRRAGTVEAGHHLQFQDHL
jgi:hypothetical protein